MPPRPLVKAPSRLGEPRADRWREGRGFSVGEVSAVGLTVGQARLLGIHVDTRRRTTWPQNVESLRRWLVAVLRGEAQPPPPAEAKALDVKRKRGRAFRGLTSAGRRARGLLSANYKETHRRKFKKKDRERRLKRRHEATRGKGNLIRISRIVT